MQRLGPTVGYLREYRDTSTDIFAALIVMCRGRQHAVRPAIAQVMTIFVKSIVGNADERRLRSDFVARDQPIETVKSGVLYSLGHDGRRQLLPFGDEIRLGIVERRFGEQHTQEVKRGAVEFGRAYTSALQRFRQYPLVPFLNRQRSPVGPIDG